MTAELGWNPRPSKYADSWIEVDLLINKFIGGIVTWGDQLKHYVKSFRIQHRSDGSDTWLNCTDTNGDTKTFVGNENTIDPAFNELQGGITARYVRLLPLSYEDGLGLRWELLACSNCVQPSVNHHTGSLSASYDGSNCIKIKDNNQIRMQWKGLVTNSNLTNLDISGKSLICSHYTTVVGIAVDSMDCYTGYVLCKIKGVNGTCRAVCGLREEQVGQPFHLLLMVTGEGAELCDVTMDLRRLPTGRSGIDHWGVFMQEIAAK